MSEDRRGKIKPPPESMDLQVAITLWREQNPVRRRRAQRGWSQADLAIHVGWSQQRVATVERGDWKRCKMTVLIAIARKLGISATLLFNEMDQWKLARPTEGTAERWIEEFF